MSMKYGIITITIFALDLIQCDIQDTLSGPIDGKLNFMELAKKHEQTPKAYYLTTEDGYILEVHNLQGNKSNPVLLSHGVFDTSGGWIIRGNTSLGISLAIKGYDTWYINYRGNRYSRNHTTLDPDQNKTYWDFSAHEYGVYDLRACIDFILNETGQKQLSIVGFSEGTTSVFILGSEYPEYNNKVNIFIALAPVVFLENARPSLSTVISVSPILEFFLPLSVQEIAGYYSMTKAVINMLCTQLAISYEICYQGGFNSVSGKDSYGIEREFFPIIVGHFPGGTSRKNLMHYAQISLRKSFARYDYGTTKNLQMYRSFTPPSYDLSRMTMRTVLVSGRNDAVSTLEDVENLKKVLPNVIDHKIVDSPRFNHLDHVWGREAYELVYMDIMDILKKFQ